MGTQGPGRKRIPNLEKLTAEDDALNSIAREAEARLAAKRAARAEAREIRMKELERQQKEVSDDEEKLSVGSRGSLRPSDYSGVLGSGSRTSSRASSARASPVVEERPERDFIDKGSRTASTLSAATLASLGGASSRRGSCDTSFSVETEASIRDMKDSLAELEERYRRAMVSNAQLHNDKSTLMYQVETLKEELSDLEELLWEERRTCDERSKDLERQRQNNSVLQFQLGGATETLRRTEELLTEHGVVVSDDVTTNGETEQNDAEDDVSAQSASRLAEEASHGGRQSMMELRLKKLFEERQSLQDQVRLLKTQLDGRQSRGAAVVQDPEGDDPDLERGSDSHLVDLQSQSCSCWSPWAQVVRFWFWF
uniref:Leucine rich repeat (in FLII) interacting protein 1b n=1 Tax=Sphaeramia orbicularis TaxID=375764 RepID=A0A673AYJ5_9TELE